MLFTKKKIAAVLSVFTITGSMFAAEQIVFKSNFAENKTLKGWNDIWDQRGIKPVRSDYYKVETVNGETYFRSEKTKNGKLLPLWGIWHILGTSGITVNDKVAEVEIEVILRKKAEYKGYHVGVGISSNRWCENGRAFNAGKQDSGIEVLGNENPAHQKLNSISSKITGSMTTLLVPRKPFNFLLSLDTWNTWRIVYDNMKKEIKFYRSADEKEPFIVKHEVDLNGVVLQTVWLSGGAAEFKSVKVKLKTR